MSKVYKHILKTEQTESARVAVGLSESDIITTDTLRDLLLSRGLTKNMNCIMGALIEENNLWEAAMTLSSDVDRQVAFRASWALEWAYIMHPEMIECRFAEFFNDLLRTKNDSVQRVYSKMLCDMLRRGVAMLSTEEALALADKCFGLLTDKETPVAVKVWQIELLADLSPRIDWIEENLTEIVRNMSESHNCTPAIAAAARHYFKRLNRDSLCGF